MRRLLALLPMFVVVLAIGCGSNANTEYTGPAITPVTGKGAGGNYGPPGGMADNGPNGPPKPPGVR